jgi:flavin reductase (DIM6/NTAB) family NADH-FMN oxidoreductase RutF
MIKGTAVNIECTLLNEFTLGEHTTFVNEVIEAGGKAFPIRA